MRTSHTVAGLDVSHETYEEIASKLRAADYAHCFLEGGVIDLHGIGLLCSQTGSLNSDTAPPAPTAEALLWQFLEFDSSIFDGRAERARAFLALKKEARAYFAGRLASPLQDEPGT